MCSNCVLSTSRSHCAVERLRDSVGFEWMAICAFTFLAMFWIALFVLSCAGVPLGTIPQSGKMAPDAHADAGVGRTSRGLGAL